MAGIEKQRRQLLKVYKQTIFRYRKKYLYGYISAQDYWEKYMFAASMLVEMEYAISTAHHYLFESERQADRDLASLSEKIEDPRGKVGVHKRILLHKKIMNDY
ncbi:hypothetical protein [Bacillus marinisedimentorum]|uniref:hypothetical protein n=1 Tax=Bacillus marinisedimentorum TaxID=1821260 RepID=UPI0007E0471D|nr:hypothetical protein [Bacillus marinisedimentorum]